MYHTPAFIDRLNNLTWEGYMDTGIIPLDSLLKVPYIDAYEGFDISPDGRWLAFSWNLSGQWEIYLLDMTANTQPCKVSVGAGAKFAPRWSPDGKRLAYALDPDGAERFDIYIYDRASDSHTNLTPDTPETIQPGFSWSPDGKWIALASDRSGRFDTYVISTQGGTPRLLLDAPYPDWKVKWSPDGDWIAVVLQADGQDFQTSLVPSEGGEPVVVADQGVPLNTREIAWSPNGDYLAFSADPTSAFRIGLFHLPTRQVSWLTDSAGDQEMPAWSKDGMHIACIATHAADSALEIISLQDRSVSTYKVAPGMHSRPLFTPDDQGVLFTFNNPQHPDDLWLLNLENGTLHQLTHSLPAWLDPVALVIPQHIHYASQDGQRVPALLYQPHGDQPNPPAVIYIHGGPNWLTYITWDPLLQHMLSRGWVVLAPNYRGSTGYGREWQQASRFDLGGKDTQDIVWAADYLAIQQLADPQRIVVTGRSYGGYLTMTSMTQYPDRWAGGSAVVPFLNWFTGHDNVRQDLIFWDLENMGDPVEHRQRYYDRSPFFFLDRIQAPVQLICGAHDPRCPANESVQARDRLIELGKRVDFKLYEDEGHSFLKTSNVIDARQRQIEFLASILEG
jgi:dipeptidyl aminopeptidase/acylaminoacyl peptidase